MKRILLVIILVIVLVVGFLYFNRRSHSEKAPVDTNAIVVIFPMQSSLYENQEEKGLFSRPNTLVYYTPSFIRTERVIANQTKNDTLTIPFDRDVLPVDVQYNYITYHYYFNKGDTIVFEFDEAVPLATCTNRKTLPADLNVTLLYKKRISQVLKVKSTNKISGVIPPKHSVEEYANKKHFLDSLTAAGALSADLKSAYEEQFKYEFVQTLFFNKSAEGQQALKSYDVPQMANNEHLLYSGFFHSFLSTYLWTDAFSAKIKSGKGISLDYEKIYEKVKSTIPNEKVRSYLLFYCLQGMMEKDSQETVTTYFAKLKEDVDDTVYFAILEKDLNNYSRIEGSTLLTDFGKTKTVDLKELIKTSANKVLYVDLWASWCMPCRAAMPASNALRKQYKNRPVVFAYVSLDSKYTAWEKASIDEGLSDYANSFLMLNPHTAPLIEEIDLKAIPRYLIFNKKGKLTFDNAPSPDNEEIEDVLNKYILE